MTYVLNLDGYLNEKGEFDYDKYKKIQEDANKRKINKVFVSRISVALLAGYMQRHFDKQIKFGLCHGTRRGLEQAWFREFLRCEVIGTEISETATKFPHTIEWDFHEVKPEWVGAVDFIYSNSWDHSFDPQRCFTAWASCLRTGGLMILEHSRAHTASATSFVDPFGIEVDALCALVSQVGGETMKVRDVIHCQDSSMEGNQRGSDIRRFVIAERLPPKA